MSGKDTLTITPGKRPTEMFRAFSQDPGTIELTPELAADLLDPESWQNILQLYARTTKLAVALIDADGHLVGTCHNPQPIWSLARDARPASPGGCLFCLETSPLCSAAAEALRTESPALVHDEAGFAHVALPLTLGGHHLGTLLTGQILDRYPEALPLQRVARDFGISPQQVWYLARQSAPISRANLTVYAELLWALGQSFLRDRYGAILESRWRKASTDAKIYAENIVSTIREPLLVLDDRFCVSSANDAFYEKFQFRADETEGHLLFELGSGQWDIPELRRLLSEVLPLEQSVENFEMECDFVHLGARTILLNAHRIDHVNLILLAIEDITERKLAEQLLHNLNQNLKHFSYASSHDLQEPLRMMKTYTQLLAREYKGKLDPKADQFLAYAMEGAERMQTLLRDLREYWLVDTRIEQCVPIDCGRVLQEAIQALQVPIAESGASVTYEPLPTVVAEEVSLAVLFQNLLSNAIKYRRPGEQPRIHTSAHKEADVWRFSVEDNGIGIDTEHLEDIFFPFKRLHGKEYPGSGIGLALCNKVVERYGGRLWVESTPGKGSTFYFTIPAQGAPL